MKLIKLKIFKPLAISSKTMTLKNVNELLLTNAFNIFVKLYLSLLSFSFFISKRERERADTIITLYHPPTGNFLSAL